MSNSQPPASPGLSLNRQGTWSEKTAQYASWGKTKGQQALGDWLGVEPKSKTPEEAMAERWRTAPTQSQQSDYNNGGGVGVGGGGVGVQPSAPTQSMTRSNSQSSLGNGTIGRKMAAAVAAASDDYQYQSQWAAQPSIFIPKAKTQITGPSGQKTMSDDLLLNTFYENEITDIYNETAISYPNSNDGQLHSPQNAQYLIPRPPPPTKSASRSNVVQPKEHTPYFIKLATLVEFILVIAECVKGGIAPMTINPWIGPPAQTLVDMGAKYGPLMHTENGRSRFVSAIFLHVGFIHYLMNMMFQMSVGKELEVAYGAIRICAIYLIAGVGGNIVSCLFVPEIIQVGASGALYGLLGCVLIDLLQNWKLLRSIGQNPWWLLFKQVIVILISLATGLLPGLDNFCHLGGFIFGILAGIVFLPTINFGKWSAVWKLSIAVASFVSIISLFSIGLSMFDNNVNGGEWCPNCLQADCLSALFNCDSFQPPKDNPSASSGA